MREEILPPSEAMQWAALKITTGLTVLWIGASLFVFCLTKGLLVLIPIGGALPLSYMWMRIIRYLFPKHVRDYELEEKRIVHEIPKKIRKRLE